MTQNGFAMCTVENPILLTGALSTGKTYTLSSLSDAGKSVGKNISVTATTGFACTHLNIFHHTFMASIGINDILPKDFFMQIAKQRRDIICKLTY